MTSLLAESFDTPSFEYALLAPMLIVFGGAIVGVLVEAFVPRSARRVTQVVLSLLTLVAAFVALLVWTRPDLGQIAASGTVAIDGPGCVPAGHHPRAGLRRDPAVRRAQRRPVWGRVHRVRCDDPGQPGRARADRRPGPPDRGVAAGLVLGRRHDAVRRRRRPADVLHRARGALAASLPDGGTGPASAAAEPGGGAQVLPARRLLVGVPALRVGLPVRLRRHHQLRRHPRLPELGPRARPAPADRHRPGRHRSVLQGGSGPVPLLGPGRVPGCADGGDRLHGVRHQGRCVRCDAAALLRRPRRLRVELASDVLAGRHIDDRGGLRAGHHADRHQADARLLVGGAGRVHPDRCHGGVRPGNLEHALLPGRLRLRHHRGVRPGHARA